MERLKISGRVITGLGEGVGFTNLDWARQQFIEKLGIDPHPGTLNLSLETNREVVKWEELLASPSIPVVPPDPQWCIARCYPVRIANKLPGAIIFPEVPGYPENQIEVIASVPLREKLYLADNDMLTLEICRPLDVEAVIFDVDGTLVDSLEAYRKVAEIVAAPLGITITMEMVRTSMNRDHSFWEMILPPEFPDRADMIRSLRAEAVRHFPRVLREFGRTIPNLDSTLQTLQKAGISLGVVTGSREEALQPLETEGVMHYFRAVVTGEDIKNRKPDPEGLLKCSRMLGVPPNKCVYVGDTPVDIQASRAAGMAAVGVLSGAGDPALLSAEGPDWIVFSHDKLSQIISV